MQLKQKNNVNNDLEIAHELRRGILALGLTDEPGKLQKLIDYLSLLQKWNKVYSLTAITNCSDMVKYHLLDGLTVVNHLGQVQNLIDIGSGMGVPGVIIAIWQPEILVTVLDSNQKKTTFLRQVAIELDLKNLTVVNSRVEEFKQKQKFDVAISRAFTDALLFIQLAKDLVKTDGQILLMKSQKILSEVEQIAKYKYVVIKLFIPGSDDVRYLLKIELT